MQSADTLFPAAAWTDRCRQSGNPEYVSGIWRRLLGDGYKFEDYYSAYGVEAQPRDLRTEKRRSNRDRRTVSDLTGDGGGEETADEGSIPYPVKNR